MVKTTLYLPEDLKTALEKMAARQSISEARLMREALEEKVARNVSPRPVVPLFPEGLGDPDAAERVDELLEGFGR